MSVKPAPGLTMGAIFFFLTLFCTPALAQPKIVYTGWGSPSEIESIDAEIAAFHRKYPDLNVTIENQFVPWDGYHEKLIVQAAAGTLPDVMLISSAFFLNIAVYDMFLDLGPYFERDQLQEEYLPPGSLSFLTVRGKLSALPAGGFRPGSPMVNIHQDLFDQAGLPYPANDWTWDDVTVYARSLTRDTNGDGAPDQFGVDFAKTTWEAVWEYMLRAHGGSIWNEDFSAAAINSEAAQQVFTFLKDLDDRWGVSGGEFNSGNVGMSIAWASEAARRLEQLPFRVGVHPLPLGPHGRGLGPATGRTHVYAISKNTQHPELAWNFVKFLVTDPEAALARRLNSVASPGYRPAFEAWAQHFPDETRAWLEVGLLYIDETPPPRYSGDVLLISYDDQQQILTKWLTRFYAGEIPIAEALSGIESELNVRLREVRQRAGESH